MNGMILVLHIVIGILLIVLIIRHFLDYQKLTNLEKINADLLLNLVAYEILFGELDNLKIKTAQDAIKDLMEKEMEKQNGQQGI